MGVEHPVVGGGRRPAHRGGARPPLLPGRCRDLRGGAGRPRGPRRRRRRRPTAATAARRALRRVRAPPGVGRPPSRHRGARDHGGIDVQQLPRQHRRPARRRQRHRRDPPHERRRRRTTRGVGGVEADRAGGRQPDPRAGPSARPGGARPRRPRPLRPRPGHGRARRGPPVRHPRRRRPGHRRAVRGLEARGRRVARPPLRVRHRRPTPVALRRPVLPEPARGGGDRDRPPLRPPISKP